MIENNYSFVCLTYSNCFINTYNDNATYDLKLPNNKFFSKLIDYKLHCHYMYL